MSHISDHSNVEGRWICPKCQRHDTKELANGHCHCGPCSHTFDPAVVYAPLSATCTNCAPGSSEEKSPGFYIGCMINDGACGRTHINWRCDGKGNLNQIVPDEVPLPFGGGTPPIPGDPDEFIKAGPFSGLSLAEAHQLHFDPRESDEAFFRRMAAKFAESRPEVGRLLEQLKEKDQKPTDE